MERLKKGIYATAMNAHIMNVYEEIEDEDLAESILTDWLMTGVPDGNELVDNIIDFGDKDNYDERLHDYITFCRMWGICPDFSKEVEEVKKYIVKMLDNPYYNVI